jgi:hypothetical protein
MIKAECSKVQTLHTFMQLAYQHHNQFSPTLVSWNKVGDPSVQQLLPVDIDGTLTQCIWKWFSEHNFAKYSGE